MKFDVAVIGGGIAGVHSAISAKIAQPTASVAIISDSQRTYPSPDPVAVISNQITLDRNMKRYGFGQMTESKIRVFDSYIAETLEHAKRRICLNEGHSNHPSSIEYEKLVLSTGSTPRKLPLEGFNLRGVFTVKWFEEALALCRYSESGKKAHVIGGGIIGLEVAEALARRGLKVTVIEALPHILGALLEPDLAEIVNRHLESRGMRIETNTILERIGGKKEVEYVVAKGEKVSTDIVVCAIGMKPNTTLADQIGVQLGQSRAVKTDERMQTTLKDVYAAGDCAETIDLITGKPVFRPIGSIGVRAAEIAGMNAAGFDKSYNGFMRMQYNKLFAVEMGFIGLTAAEAKNFGLTVDSVDVHLKEPKTQRLAMLLPTKTHMKAIVRKDNETIVGWQLVAFRQNACNFWASCFLMQSIQSGRTLSQIQELGFRVK